MRKRAIIAIMLAVGISQAGMAVTYTRPVKVCAETKTGDKYINGNTKITDDDIMSSIVLGDTVKDGCKYVVERNGKYYPSVYHSEKNEEADGGVARWCEFTKGYSSKADAVKEAQAVPKDVSIFLDFDELGVSKVKDLSGVKFYVYNGDSETVSATLDKLDSFMEEPKEDNTDDVGKDDVDDSEADTKVDGKVKVSVKNRNIGNDLDASNKLTVTWDLKKDKASSFEVYGGDCYTNLSGKKSGSKTISVDLANGSYGYEFTTESGGVVTGTFKVANTFTDDGASGGSSESGEDSININEKAPKLKFSSIPKKVAFGQSFDLKIESDKDAVIRFNGQGSDDYRKKAKFTIWENGEYIYSAIGKSGKETTGSIKVNCFKNEKYNRNSFWTGNTVGNNTVSSIKKLVQTGMYDTKMLVVSAILGISGVGVLGYRLYKRRKGHGSNEKNS